MLTLSTLYGVTAVVLFGAGLHAVVTRRHLVRKILALNVMGSSIFLLLLALAYRTPGEAPDPVPHAMVLTGIVVAVSATAFALALARRVSAETGAPWLPEDRPR